MLGVSIRISRRVFPKIQMIPGGCLFWFQKVLLQQSHILFDIKGF